ncbi:MAG: helix-turn-helix domain-containing protein [Oribacterium sp.]|nr:helix-turn-helix domain-containing protein [Oribacterium sp.]MBQ8665808.1 helix-turn-helix domain-containing protein [Lachnospiraceae bacterium]
MSKKGDYKNYEYVEGDIVMEAVFGNHDAIGRIYNRYMGNIVDCIVSIARKKEEPVQSFPMEDLKQTIWCDLLKDIAAFRPR